MICTGRPLNFVAREVPGDHDHHDGPTAGKNKILVMEGGGLRIVHMGDQGRLLTQEQIDAIGKPDLLMLPVGGYFTINAAEAHQIMDQLQPTVTIPMHYRHNRVGFQMLDTLDAFLETDVPVVRATERQLPLFRICRTRFCCRCWCSEMSYRSKQMLIVRRDLKMRKGKIAAQASHAAVGGGAQGHPEGGSGGSAANRSPGLGLSGGPRGRTEPLTDWFQYGMAKICVYVDSEEELLALDRRARRQG